MTTSFAPESVLPTPQLMSGTDSVVLVAEHGMVQVPSAEVLITSMYSRAGQDLVISDPEGVKYIVKGFFNADPPPSLTDGQGMTILGEYAAQYTGPANVNVYAQAGGSNAGPQIGQIRSGEGTIIRADGSTVPFKVGTPLFAGDTIETDDGAAGVVLIDGTTLAIDAKAELVLDELIYDPGTKSGKESISLVSGAASFVSGQIAKSGQDNMVFKTPVATIGIRGTKVFASYDPDTGDITILNRPIPGADGSVTVGKIALFLPSGEFVGEISAANTAWQFNPSKGESPTPKTLSETQVAQIAGKVESIVTTLVQQQQQQQQQQQDNQNNGQQGEGPGGNQEGGGEGQGAPPPGEGGNQQGAEQGAAPGEGEAPPADGPAEGPGEGPPQGPPAPAMAPHRPP